MPNSSSVPGGQLAYLPTDTPEGMAYIAWMNMALAFARENRALMMERVKEIVREPMEACWLMVSK